jgi:hypothetical protein
MSVWQRNNDGVEPTVDRPVVVAGLVTAKLAFGLVGVARTVLVESTLARLMLSKSWQVAQAPVWLSALALLPVRTDTMGRNWH